MSETQNTQSDGRGDGSEGGKLARSRSPQHWVYGYLPAGIGFLCWIGSILPQPHRFASGSYLGLMWWIPVSVVLHDLGH